MAYVGRGIDNISNASILDVISFTNSAGPYNLTTGSGATAFTPISVQALVISVDGVIQAPDSYTISAATITFGVSMASSLTNDFIVHNGVGLITEPSDGSVSTAKIENLAVTAGKLAATQDLSTKTITLPASVSGLGTGITNAQLAGSIDVTTKITGVVPTANLGSGSASSTTILYGDQTYKTEPAEYDDSVVQSNIAMLGFKVAVNGSLTRYNLVDQSIDEFYDTSGVDASASTNEQRVASGSNFYYWGGTGTNPTGATSTDTSVSGYTTLVLSAASGNIVVGSGGNVDVLAVAGGGSGGSDYAGGGGAGGLIYKTGHALTAQTYAWVTGAGGAGSGAAGGGNNGVDSTWTDASASVEFTASGGGAGASESGSTAPAAGGSGGGGTYASTAGASENQSGESGDSATYGFGNDGGAGIGGPSNRGGGGGGAGAVGADAAADQLTTTGAGGVGKDYSAIFGTAVGASGWFAGGGGGGAGSGSYQVAGAGGTGGGSAGSLENVSSSAATANTGGGSGGCGTNGASTSGAGGSGIILLRYADGTFQTAADLTLQSTDVTAGTAPTYGEFVTLIENAAGTATLNTDIKGYISRDSGANFTQGTLVDEGTWGTNKKVLGFHDLDISSQPSGTSMCYKITTHNQSGAKETRIYASSIGWR